MSRTEDVFKPALTDKKIPVLTLDNKWHQLFTQMNPNKRIKRLEEKMNELLKRQGKANTEIKEIKKLKKKLLQEIMDNAEEAAVENNPKAQRKADENRRLVRECNEKIEGYEDEILALPKEIDRVNYELMLATMEVCYEQLKSNEREIEEITKWVAQIRTELKEKLVYKQEIESINQGLYSYMHDIFGADVINLFDMKYQVKETKNVEKQSSGQENK